jgi:hypothetical protein
MQRAIVERHPIDAKPYREVWQNRNAKLVKYFDGAPPVHRDNLDWAASTGWDTLMSNTLFSPTNRQMWTAARAVAQARAGAFAAGLSPSARASVPFGDKMVEIDRFPEFVDASPIHWLEGWACAALTRDAACLELLARVPDEIFRASRLQIAEPHEPWRGALIAYYKGNNPTALVERALFLCEPAQLAKQVQRLLLPDVAKLWAARFRTMLPLFHKDPEAFNQALLAALEEHKKFYSKKTERERAGGFLAMDLAALCALAHDTGLPIEVESEYLPMTLIQGMRDGESSTSTVKGSASSAKPAKSSANSAKSPAKRPATRPAKASRGRR